MPRDIPYNPSHADTALGEELPSRWRSAPRLRALVSAFCLALQLVEDEAYDLIVSLDLDTATGLFLDIRGGRVFEPRRGLADDEYRAIIRAKARALRACGTAADVYEVAQLVAPPDTVVELRELPIAAYEVTFVVDPSRAPSDNYRRRMRALMDLARPIGWNPEYLLVVSRPAFAFDGPVDPLKAGYDEGGFIGLL
jgi:hypothetical protein